ncbi:MAG: hypothetical protein U0Q15_04030 [Kineosporiaceae bacterium]
MSSHDALARLQAQPALRVRQRITPMVNRYEIRAINGDGSHGDILAMAQQKRMALKEQVTFYADEDRTVPLFGFKARNVVDLAGVSDVLDATGSPIGTFRKDFAASLLRSTWYCGSVNGPEARGQERNMPIALLRRFVFEGLPYHFDFVYSDGRPLMAVNKKFAFGRDSYDVLISDPAADRRVIAAMAVALDALQAR